MTAAPRIADLGARNPEWAPWLAVISALLEEIGRPGWDGVVPHVPKPRSPAVPLLAGRVLSPCSDSIVRAYQLLARTARESGSPGFFHMADANVDACALFQVAINRDSERLRAAASDAGVDPAAFEALALLLPVPFLHACNRRWGALASARWNAGYCGVCGAWPAFAEVLGIERTRHLRCGQCGSGWEMHGLICVYCGMADHTELATLVTEDGGAASIDACKRCRGYLKVFTRLKGSAPAEVIIDDLASAELDIAATVRGYKRPQRTGYTLQVTLGDA
jgi:FdhE protein